MSAFSEVSIYSGHFGDIFTIIALTMYIFKTGSTNNIRYNVILRNI